jgi:2-oxoglutarate dehydrogenase E2 component (dihydrolipoamide succinyltransferase)
MLRRIAPCTVPRFCGAAGALAASPALLRRWATFNVNVPGLGGESVKTGKIASVSIKVGDAVPEDTVLCVIESDKSSVDVRTDKSGVVTAVGVKEGDMVEVGALVAVIDEQAVEKKRKAGGGAAAPTPAAPTPVAPTPAAPTFTAPTPAPAPQVARPAPATPAPAAAATAAAPAPGAVRAAYTKPLSMMRLRIAERLKASQNENALLTTFNEIDVTALVNMRNKYKDAFEKKHGVKLGLMSPFLKAAAHALIDVPVINASWGKGVVEYHDYVDITVAVATPKGLVVPVIRNVEKLSYADIEKTLEEFAVRARDNKITPDDMAGGTFTVSNGGTFGSWMGTPIVNPPQSAILGMHAIKKKPWVDEKDQVVVRQIMAVALTYDHRLIDGRDAVTFLVKIKNIIEDPTRMLLDLA